MDFQKDSKKIIDSLLKLRLRTPFESSGKVVILEKDETPTSKRLSCEVVPIESSDDEGLSFPQFSFSLEEAGEEIRMTLGVKGKRLESFTDKSVPKITRNISSILPLALRGWNWYAQTPKERLKAIIKHLRKMSGLKGFTFGDIFIRGDEVVVDLEDEEGDKGDFRVNWVSDLMDYLARRGVHARGTFDKGTNRIHVHLLDSKGSSKSAKSKKSSAPPFSLIFALQEDLTQAFARMSLPATGNQSALVNLEDNEVMDLDIMFTLFQDGRIFLEGKEGEGPDFNLSVFESSGRNLFEATLTVGGKKVKSFGADDARGILKVILPVLQQVSSRYAWVSADDSLEQREIFRKLRSHLITLQGLKGYPFGKIEETRQGYEVELAAPLRPQQMTHLRRWAHQFGLRADFSVKGDTLHIRPVKIASRRAALLPHSALSKWVAQVKKNRAFMLGTVTLISPEEYELTFKVSGGDHTVSVSLGVNSGRTILIYNPDDGPAQRFVLQGRSPKEIPDLLNAALKESHASWRLEGGF